MAVTLILNPLIKRLSLITRVRILLLIKLKAYGQDIWFPIELWKQGTKLIEIGSLYRMQTWWKVDSTPVKWTKRKGKGVFAIDDHRRMIKGFLIGKTDSSWRSNITIERLVRHFHRVAWWLSWDSSRRKLSSGSKCFIRRCKGKSDWIRPFSMIVETGLHWRFDNKSSMFYLTSDITGEYTKVKLQKVTSKTDVNSLQTPVRLIYLVSLI
jgi:hypothetical protein